MVSEEKKEVIYLPSISFMAYKKPSKIARLNNDGIEQLTKWIDKSNFMVKLKHIYTT